MSSDEKLRLKEVALNACQNFPTQALKTVEFVAVDGSLAPGTITFDATTKGMDAAGDFVIIEDSATLMFKYQATITLHRMQSIL